MDAKLSENHLQIDLVQRLNELLDELKIKDGVKTDSELSKSLGVTRAFICALRKGRSAAPLSLEKIIFKKLGRPISEADIEIFTPLKIRHHLVQNNRLLLQKVRRVVLDRASGRCELCNMNASEFITTSAEQFLQVFHVKPYSKGGSHTPHNVAVLCPNCYRKMEICPSKEDEKKLLRILENS